MTQSVFESQFALLQKELDLIDSTIRQNDEITKSIKNWAIVTWTAAVGVGLANAELKKIIWLTAVIPILFWIVDASYRRVQRSFIVRNREIRDFVNSEEFRQAAENKSSFEFDLLVMRSGASERYDTMLGIMFFRTVGLMYAGLVVVSFVAQLLAQ